MTLGTKLLGYDNVKSGYEMTNISLNMNKNFWYEMTKMGTK